MRYSLKEKTWRDHWSDTIRMIFKDAQMRQQMLLPEDVTILQFIDKYFIESMSPEEILTDEKVRISYYDEEGSDFGNPNVKGRYRRFDIYVKNDVLHSATKDKLQYRTHLIAERLKYLLLKDEYVCHIHYEFGNDYDLWTKMIGYQRYHIYFAYKITV